MGSPFPEPCERHSNITWLARVPSDSWRDGEECFGCFIVAKQCEVLEAAAEVAKQNGTPACVDEIRKLKADL